MFNEIISLLRDCLGGNEKLKIAVIYLSLLKHVPYKNRMTGMLKNID